MIQIAQAIIALGKIFGYIADLQKLIVDEYYQEQLGKLDEHHAKVCEEMKFLTTKLKGAQTDEERKLYPIAWNGPVLVNGKLAVVSSKGELKLISAASGEVTATLNVAEDIYTPPVVAGGRIYLINKDATLYSLQ